MMNNNTLSLSPSAIRNRILVGPWGALGFFFLADMLGSIISSASVFYYGTSWDISWDIAVMMVMGVVVLLFPAQLRILNFTITLRSAAVALVIGVLTANLLVWVESYFSSMELPSYDLLTVLKIVILAPIVEEFFFRGFVLNSLLKKWPVPVAVLVTSILFALGHDSFWIAFAAGSVYCTLFLLFRRSLTVTILAHSAYNFAVAFPAWLIFKPLYTHHF
jgi:membrane protease YdiL (CAAX protease family)